MSQTAEFKDTVIGTCVYKDHTYALLWEGETKNFGRRAKLAWTRALEKVFWVDGTEICDVDTYPQPVDFEDFAATQPRRDLPRERRTEEIVADAMHIDETPADVDADQAPTSYCAHCGQLIAEC